MKHARIALIVTTVAVLMPAFEVAAQTEALPFNDGIKRLILHASSGFLADRGAKTADQTAGATHFATPFSIAGFTSCAITVDNSGTLAPSADCQAYHGSDSAVAASTYSQLKSALTLLAQQAGGTVSESTKVQGSPPISVTSAIYAVGGGVEAVLDTRAFADGNYNVALGVDTL
jgi:hypothetical protein